MNGLDAITQLGFCPITEWIPVGPRIKLRSLDWADHGGWLYAFVVDGRLSYIGLTDRVLRSRMDNYRDGHELQVVRPRGLILAELNAGHSVNIYAFPQSDRAKLIAGELYLRERLRPPWNVNQHWTGTPDRHAKGALTQI